jgi:hypothetical protein
MSAGALARAVVVAVGVFCAVDKREIAIEERYGARRSLRQESAMKTCFAGGTDGTALRALQQTR